MVRAEIQRGHVWGGMMTLWFVCAIRGASGLGSTDGSSGVLGSGDVPSPKSAVGPGVGDTPGISTTVTSGGTLSPSGVSVSVWIRECRWIGCPPTPQCYTMGAITG